MQSWPSRTWPSRRFHVDRSLLLALSSSCLRSIKFSTILTSKTPFDACGLRKYENVIESAHSEIRKGRKIRAKKPLRINELSYIITVCYPAKCRGMDLCVYRQLHCFQILILPNN